MKPFDCFGQIICMIVVPNFVAQFSFCRETLLILWLLIIFCKVSPPKQKKYCNWANWVMNVLKWSCEKVCPLDRKLTVNLTPLLYLALHQKNLETSFKVNCPMEGDMVQSSIFKMERGNYAGLTCPLSGWGCTISKRT